MQHANLILADLTRIKKDKALLITLLVGLGYAVFSLIMFLILDAVDKAVGIEMSDVGRTALSMFFNSDSFVLIAGAAICIFNGSDFSFNTVRNKIIAGNGRLKIYFSQLAVNLMIFFGFFTVYLVFMTGACAALFQINDFGDMMLRFLSAIPLYIAMVAIITFIIMTLKSRTGAVVTNLLILMLLPGILSFVLLYIQSETAVMILESNPYSMLAKILGADMASLMGDVDFSGIMGEGDLSELLGSTATTGHSALEGMTALKAAVVAICYGGLFTGVGAWQFVKTDIK